MRVDKLKELGEFYMPGDENFELFVQFYKVKNSSFKFFC